MKKIITISVLVFLTKQSKAQFKFILQGGKSFSTLKAKTDSLLMADKANFLQGKLVYTFGHLSLGVTVGTLNQQARNYVRNESLPLVPPTSDNPTQVGGGIKTTHVLIGPEICISNCRKLKFNVGLRAGVSFLNPNVNKLLLRDSLEYFSNSLKSKTAFTLNAGLGTSYAITEKIAIGLLVDFHTFKIKALNKTISSAGTVIREIPQQRCFINTGASIIFKF